MWLLTGVSMLLLTCNETELNLIKVHHVVDLGCIVTRGSDRPRKHLHVQGVTFDRYPIVKKL